MAGKPLAQLYTPDPRTTAVVNAALGTFLLSTDQGANTQASGRAFPHPIPALSTHPRPPHTFPIPLRRLAATLLPEPTPPRRPPRRCGWLRRPMPVATSPRTAGSTTTIWLPCGPTR